MQNFRINAKLQNAVFLMVFAWSAEAFYDQMKEHDPRSQNQVFLMLFDRYSEVTDSVSKNSVSVLAQNPVLDTESVPLAFSRVCIRFGPDPCFGYRISPAILDTESVTSL